jgi:hypothetical protein
MKKPSGISCPWSTRSFGVWLTTISNRSDPTTHCRARPWFTRPTCGLLGSQPVELQNRAHFIAVASRLMRQVLVDYARERRAAKRDGGCRIAFEFLDALPVNAGTPNLLALDDALDELSRIDERQAKIVEMKFFGGLSAPEISRSSGSLARHRRPRLGHRPLWLHRQMSRTASP